MKNKYINALINGAIYVIGIGALGLVLFWPSIIGADELVHEFKNPSFSGVGLSLIHI